MANQNERWIDRLQFSSLFGPPPQDAEQHKAQIYTYVKLFGQFISEKFPDYIDELVRSRYPSDQNRLLDDVLAKFVLHHPEHGRDIILPIISCIIDGLVEYKRSGPPFASFVSLAGPNSQSEYPEQWALACVEILRILTHYNKPIFKRDTNTLASTSKSTDGGELSPVRPLSPWITDILLAAPLCFRSDYFRWCGGVTGNYEVGELKPPSTASSRWGVANGAGVILSVCEDEVVRYKTAKLTTSSVPALVLPPPTPPLTAEHFVACLPALEPYACLFHRYYAIASPNATQRLLRGLLEAPPSWAPDALDVAVQLVGLLREVEAHASGIRLPRNWMQLHFLGVIGIAMSTRAGVVADAAAAFLYRILSQPALLFPPRRQIESIEAQHELQEIMESAAAEATAQGIASMLFAHGPEVEGKICTIWEAAYGLIPLSSLSVHLPEIIVANPVHPPMLSWKLYIPLLKVLAYLPRGSPSEKCLMNIFAAVVKAILQRTYPPESKNRRRSSDLAELYTMFHSLFLEHSCASVQLASRLVFVVLTVCLSHGVNWKCGDKRSGEGNNKQGPIAAFDSFVIAAFCGLSFALEPFKGNELLFAEFRNGVDSVVHRTRRILTIVEELLCWKPSDFGGLWSFSSKERVGADMVSSHVCDLFRHSEPKSETRNPCMRALLTLIRCKWDKEIHSRAYFVFNFINDLGVGFSELIGPTDINSTPVENKVSGVHRSSVE